MGAKLSRRKSDSAAGTEGAPAETPAAEKPATESAEQNPAEARAEVESKPTQVTPDVDTPPREPAPGALEAISQAVEEAGSTVREQIVAPVEDVVNKGVGAVEAMMAAISLKDEPAAPPPSEPNPEPLVGLSKEATTKNDTSILDPPENPVESSPLEDLLSSDPIPEPLLPKPMFAATVEDPAPLTVENEAEIDAQASLEGKDLLMGMMQEAAPPTQPLNFEVNVDPPSWNSEPVVALGDMKLGANTAVTTVDDLI